MPRQKYSAGEAARRLGISLDTLRRWDREGRIRTTRDNANRRLIAASEIDRLRSGEAHELSARNRFSGTVREVKVDGLLAQVELEAGPFRIVSVITSEAARELGLEPGRRRRPWSRRPRSWSSGEGARRPLCARCAGGSGRNSRSRRAHGLRRGVADRGLPADRPLAALQLRRLRSARAPDSPGRTGGCLRRRQPEAAPAALPRWARLEADHVRHEQADRARAEVEPRAHHVGRTTFAARASRS